MQKIQTLIFVIGMATASLCLGHGGGHGGGYSNDSTEQVYPSDDFLGEDLFGNQQKQEERAYLDGEYVEKCTNARTCDEYGHCEWLCR